MRERLERKLEEMGEYSVHLQDCGEELVARGFYENAPKNRFSLRDYSCILAGNALFYIGVWGEAVSEKLTDEIYKRRQHYF